MSIAYQTFDNGSAPTDGAPFIVNFGGGVDSTAMLIELARRGIRPDLILFADTGSERPETYTHVEAFSAWLVEHGMPAVTVVRRYGEDGRYGLKSRRSSTGDGYTTIEDNCLQNETLPSEAFNRGGCSVKWKHEPMDHWLAENEDIRAARELGLVPVKAIGFDCGPIDGKRKGILAGEAAAKKGQHEGGFRYWYPLRDWGWDRDACVAAIEAEGLEVPVKSSCYFCPNMKPDELRDLHAKHPDLFARAIAIEDTAHAGKHGLRIEGLWRRTRKSDNRPGSWRVWAEREGMIEPRVPKDAAA